jgi:hypothetical protein
VGVLLKGLAGQLDRAGFVGVRGQIDDHAVEPGRAPLRVATRYLPEPVPRF